MPDQNQEQEGKQRGATRTIVGAWLIAGTLDITAASIYYPIRYDLSLEVLYQNIASGVFGARAFAGGTLMSALGLAFHYIIALIWTVIFYAAYPRIGILQKNRFAAGMAYGILVWAVMNLVVLPLSNVNRSPLQFIPSLIAALILMFCIGLPLSMIIGKHYSLRGQLPSHAHQL